MELKARLAAERAMRERKEKERKKAEEEKKKAEEAREKERRELVKKISVDVNAKLEDEVVDELTKDVATDVVR